MTPKFLEKYYNDYILPHGFSNSKVGKGHLNVYGHQMIADELANVICQLEVSP